MLAEGEKGYHAKNLSEERCVLRIRENLLVIAWYALYLFKMDYEISENVKKTQRRTIILQRSLDAENEMGSPTDRISSQVSSGCD